MWRGKEILLRSQNRYVAISGDERCFIELFNPRILLFLQGNISVFIYAISASNSSSMRSEAIEKAHLHTGVSQKKMCSFTEYNATVTCIQMSEHICSFGFPTHCNATLETLSVKFTCPGGAYTAIIYHSGDFYELNQKSHNINQVNGYPFQHFPMLKSLILDDNMLSSLPAEVFGNLSLLTHLSLRGNTLAKIYPKIFQSLGQLDYLSLRDNQLTQLDAAVFKGLTKLNYLSLRGNNLATLEEELFNETSVLTELDLSFNKLTALPSGLLRGLTKLESLEIKHNNLTKLRSTLLQDVTNLKTLRCNNNRLVVFHGNTFNVTKNLVKLFMSQNMLTKLPNGLFKGLWKLKVLKLQNNNLIMLEKDIFNETSELTNFYLSNNKLTILPSGLFQRLWKIKVLKLKYNNIIMLEKDIFNETSELTELYLSDNELTILPSGLFKRLTKLRKIKFDLNQIASVDEDLFSTTKDLERISIHGNNFNIVPKGLFRELQELTHLFIYDLPLQSIPSKIFQDLINLETLDLGRDQLTHLNKSFEGYNRLRILDLNGNKLTNIGKHVFKGLWALEMLFLESNELISLAVDIFQDTIGLIVLDLSSNKLLNVPNISPLIHLRYINLRENTLTMVSSFTFSGLQNHTGTIVSQTEVCECYVPPKILCTALEVRSPYLTCDRLLSDTTLVILMWLIGLNALGGNTFVLICRKGQSDRNNIQSFILSNLAISDLLMGVYMILIASADIYFGENFPMQAETWRSGITCRVAGTISILSSEDSVSFVTLISIDRFVNIKYPFSLRKLAKKSLILVVVMLWLVAMVLGLIPSISAGRSFKFYDNSHVCVGLPLALIEKFNKSVSHERLTDGGFGYDSYSVHSQSLGEVPGLYFVTAMFLGLNCICYLIILLCYAEIVRVVYKSSKRVGLNKEMTKQVKMTAKVAAVVLNR